MTGIDTSTGATVGTAQVEGEPSPAALSPDGKTLVVAVSGAETDDPGEVAEFWKTSFGYAHIEEWLQKRFGL